MKLLVCPAYRKIPVRGSFCLLVGLWAGCALFAANAAGSSAAATKKINSYATACIIDARNIHVEVQGSGKQTLSGRAKEILQRPDRWSTFVTGNKLRVPYDHLSGRYKRLAIDALFPTDSFSQDHWTHVVTFAAPKRGGETLWRIATWFTGKGTAWSKIKLYNKLKSDKIHLGQKIKIPRALLLSSFVEPQRVVTKWGELVLKPDHAVYKLKRGESIWGNVVPRFTDSAKGKDARRATTQIVKRSGIRDPQRIKPGTEIKIPIDILSNEFRPYSLSSGAAHASFDRRPASRRKKKLAGVAVILDAGHGGEDPGTLGKLETHEDDYVYDIMCRVKRLLERDTGARVLTTIIDGNSSYAVLDYHNFRKDKDEYLLTTPRYNNANTTMSVNLRWYLANSYYRRLVREGFDKEKIVFTSFHADSLGSSTRGAMVYVPDAYHRRGRNGFNNRAYKRFKEVREKPYVEFTWEQRRRSEELSRGFARALIDAFHKGRVKVHDEPARRGSGDPATRDVIVRGRHTYVPGVLRYNETPVKVLVEVLNLNNTTDCRRIKDPDFREMVAKAYVRALERFYGG
jgi:N-acetylmuramoyl-L-alanine amidase